MVIYLSENMVVIETSSVRIHKPAIGLSRASAEWHHPQKWITTRINIIYLPPPQPLRMINVWIYTNGAKYKRDV